MFWFKNKRKKLEDIVEELDLRLEVGEIIEHWQVDEMLEGYSEKVKHLVWMAVDDENEYGMSYIWEEIDDLKDSDL